MAITKIQAGALPADVITTAAIDDASITHAKLHTTMDLSSKTVTLPSLSQTIVNSSHIQMGGNLDVVGQIGAYDNPGSSWGTMILRATDFEFKNAGGTIKMVLDTSGNVGIGEINPLGKLHVKTADSGATADASADELVIEGSGNTGISILSGTSNVGSIYFGDSGTNWDGYIAYNQSSRSMTLGTAAGGGSVTINSTGNVGIGTATPSTMLHLSAGTTGSVGGSHAGITMTNKYDNPDNSWSIKPAIQGISNTGLEIRDVTDNRSVMVFDGSGNVGIGTSVPTDKFEIHHNDAYEFSLKFNQGNNNIVSGFGQQQSILAYADGASNTDQYYAGITFGLWDATHNSKDGSIHFHTAVDGTVTTGLRITGTGEVLAALEPVLNMAVGTTNANHAKLTVYSGMGDKPALLLSNADGGANAYANRNSRYLTSNGSNWIVDGRDPIAVIGTNSSSTDKFPSTGLVMHNESQTDNTFSTPIMFGNRSNSGAYNTAYAYIAGRKVGQGVDSNWSTGEIWIDTAGRKHNGNDEYMDHSPAIKIRNTGTVDMRWQPFSYGTLGGNNLTNGTGWTLSPLVTQGLSYNNNASHGYGLTVAEPGYYMCYGTSLYTPGANGYVYIGWAINGNQMHHWHSNHSISSNHDWVSSIIRWCNAGDHLTIENSSASVSSQWGGGHSQYYVWKVG